MLWEHSFYQNNYIYMKEIMRIVGVHAIFLHAYSHNYTNGFIQYIQIRFVNIFLTFLWFVKQYNKNYIICASLALQIRYLKDINTVVQILNLVMSFSFYIYMKLFSAKKLECLNNHNNFQSINVLRVIMDVLIFQFGGHS